jgi:ankyrin repeat protein
MKAITNRDNQTLTRLLATTPDIANLAGPHPRWGGRPQPLHVAIESDNWQAFRLLLNAGANVNGNNQGYDGWSPLMLAIHWKRAEMRDELLDREANVDLVSALMLKDDRRVAKLLKNPLVLQGPFPNDATPLHFARTLKSARLLLAKGMNGDAKDKYGKTAPQLWSEAQRPGLVRLAASLGSKPPLDIYKAVEQGQLKQVRKLLASGVDVNSRFPTGSQGTLLHNPAFNGDLALVKLLVAKGANLSALDHEHQTTPAEWARFALNAFNRKPCEAVAQYLEDRMKGMKVAPETKPKVPEATVSAQQFRTMFPAIKSRFDERPSVPGLICKQGFYKNCCVLKLQKASWTNDRMDRVQNETGIFFSIWTTEKDLSRVNYNIHALKLRRLKSYSISSCDFADDFRDRFASVHDAWPNVSVKHGPLTLMQGWIEVTPDNTEKEVAILMERFEQVSPMIDRLLQAHRK